ncbi:uncharacterized protein PITG_12442 [Phytophthora infestans T30-4]|uniref:Uncharacterized protein n=1 Tax=Phytophthora infestans (strain T30-4) TaxID=403677 RepID=D0NKI8_PHYIT|nr:uncharacterized protein PITG_12442 [Phytophthora infestans T30-4]EEY60124.1 conserved hypothetical protein [Phytophthora infestans T30-4]|eukprot:XP_002900331.1 conserved hypothetical protein [Phytophthora infestans T30-4]
MDRLEEEKKRLEEAVKDLEDRADVLRPREALQRCQHSNKVLREVLHAQRRAIAGAASIIAHHFCTGPFDTPTKLSKDPVKRRAALMKMRSQRLSCAYEFMMEMLRHMDVTLDFCEQKRFTATNGDVCSERFEIVPLPVARSVKRISMSEVDGDITIRENDEPQLSINVPVAQHRFVTTIANMVQMDTNNAAFAEYRPPGPGVEEIGFSINDPIDEDELYPYRPETTCRVRQDVTVIIMVAKHRDKEGNPLIVFSRWWSLCLRKSHIHVPKLIADRIRNGLESVSASMLAAAERAGAGGPTGGSVAVI